MAPNDQSEGLHNLQSNKPGFYYGYVIVIASFVVVMMGWGIFYIYGVFFNPLTDEFGWSRAVTSAACSLAVLVSGIMGILAGRLSDRLGPKKVIMFCTVILAIGYVLMAVIHSIWQFYVLYGLIIATGLCGFWSPPISTLAHWFIDRRGLVTGIVGGGISVGTLIMAPVITQLIVVYGWRASYVIVGAGILVVSMIAAQFLKQSPREMGLKAYGETKIKSRIPGTSEATSVKEVIRTRPFWIVCIIYFCFGLAHLTIMVHIVPEAIGIGISPINAAVILSIIGIIGLLGRITLGSLTDKLQVKRATIISLVFFTVSLIWLQQSDSLWKLYIFGAVFGFGYGGLSCAQSLLAVELFGLSTVGVITAIFSFSFNVGGAVGPVLAGYIFDVSRSYQWAFFICMILSAIALVCSLFLKSPKKSWNE